VGIDQSTLVRIESGRNIPKVDILQKIADVLECSLQDFLEDEKNTCIIQHNQSESINAYVFGNILHFERELEALKKIIEAKEHIIGLLKEKILFLEEKVADSSKS